MKGENDESEKGGTYAIEESSTISPSAETTENVTTPITSSPELINNPKLEENPLESTRQPTMASPAAQMLT